MKQSAVYKGGEFTPPGNITPAQEVPGRNCGLFCLTDRHLVVTGGGPQKHCRGDRDSPAVAKVKQDHMQMCIIPHPYKPEEKTRLCPAC